MKILLLHPSNTEEIPIGYPRTYAKQARSSLPPLWLLYLASALGSEGYEVNVVDMIASNIEINELPKILQHFHPDLIGVTAIIGLWPSVLKVFRVVKQYDISIITVVGGPNATQYPEETLSHPEIDYLIVGPGQLPLLRLCNQLNSGNSRENIENCYQQGIQGVSFSMRLL